MTDFAFLKLMIRLTGVVLMAIGLPQFIQGASMLVAMIDTGGRLGGSALSSTWMTVLYIAGPLGALLEFMIGLNLFLGGKWLVERCRRDMIGRCGLCGYDIHGLTDAICPECGAQIEVMVRKQDGLAADADSPPVR